MLSRYLYGTISILSLLALTSLDPRTAARGQEIPRDWVDPDTGHRIIRLSTSPVASLFTFIRMPIRPTARS